MSQQLTSEDRAVLAQLLSTNMPKSEIPKRLKKHRSTDVDITAGFSRWSNASRDSLLARVSDRRAATVRAAAEERLAALPDALVRTVTSDNGKEFAQHERLSAATGIDVYFAHPYAAWERGTNAHTNGLVRQYTPKGTDFTATSHRAVAAIQSSLNNRPRKRHDYRTPREVLQHWAQRRGVAFGI